MMMVGAIFSSIQLILAEIFQKMHFWPKNCQKWENCNFWLNLRPNGLLFAHNLSLSLCFDHAERKREKNQPKSPKMVFFVFFGVS